MMKLFCIIFLSTLLAACGVIDTHRGFFSGADDFVPDERPVATTLVYDCNGYEFVARVGPGEIALWLPEGYVILSQARSASGTLYEESDISFWSKGDEALLIVADQYHQNCRLLPERVPWEDARRRGVDFRGVGNEPGWFVEIQEGQQMLLVLDYGTRRVLIPKPAQEGEVGSRVYSGTSGKQDVRVEVIETPCVDTMNGNTFPARVAVTLNDIVYQGCGERLDYPWQD